MGEGMNITVGQGYWKGRRKGVRHTLTSLNSTLQEGAELDVMVLEVLNIQEDRTCVEPMLLTTNQTRRGVRCRALVDGIDSRTVLDPTIDLHLVGE
jgi:hypothetical protein